MVKFRLELVLYRHPGDARNLRRSRRAGIRSNLALMLGAKSNYVRFCMKEKGAKLPNIKLLKSMHFGRNACSSSSLCCLEYVQDLSILCFEFNKCCIL